MKLLGVGLSRTGTTSLQAALVMLGLRTVGYEEERLRAQVCGGWLEHGDYRCYDDVDAALDLPAAYFWRQIGAAYPGLRYILTVRDLHEWWRSIEYHFNVRYRLSDQPNAEFRRKLRTLVYGSPHAEEGRYKAAFSRHVEEIQISIPPEQLLTMDISAGDGWQELCGFLNVPVPPGPFPWLNRTHPSE